MNESTGTPENQAEHKPVTFSSEQQQRLDEIIKEVTGRTARSLRDELATARAELERVRAEKQSGSDADLTATVERLRAEVAEHKANADSAVTRERQTRRDALVRTELSKHAFEDPSDILNLSKGEITFDKDGNVVIVDEYGQPRLNKVYKPMSLPEYFEDLKVRKAYLVKKDTGTAVSNGSIEHLKTLFGPGSNAKAANDLAMKNKPEYNRLRALAKQAGLVV